MKEHEKTNEEVIAELTCEEVKLEQNEKDVAAIIEHLERTIAPFYMDAIDVMDRLVELLENR